ncbi:MAG: rRNA maturation RNase YbeY, partial [Spongiibacteraceae bacterium]
MSLDLDLQVACAETSAIPSIEQLTQWTELALSGRRDTTELTIRIVDEDESAALNQQYRGKDGATNVLSFPADIPAELE